MWEVECDNRCGTVIEFTESQWRNGFIYCSNCNHKYYEEEEDESVVEEIIKHMEDITAREYRK